MELSSLFPGNSLKYHRSDIGFLGFDSGPMRLVQEMGTIIPFLSANENPSSSNYKVINGDLNYYPVTSENPVYLYKIELEPTTTAQS